MWSNAEPLLCSNDPDLFLGVKDWQIKEAKRICARCPEAAACLRNCLEFEAASGETMKGVHGGTTPAERNNYRARSSV